MPSGFRAGIRAVFGLLAFQVVLVDRDEIDRLDAEWHETAIPCHVGMMARANGNISRGASIMISGFRSSRSVPGADTMAA